MKKIAVILMLVMFAGCSTNPAESVQSAPEEPTVVNTATVEPTAIPEPTQDVTEADYILNQLFVNPVAVFREDANAMAENQGGQFGFIDGKSHNAEEDIFEFTAGSDGGYFGLNTILTEFVDNHQAGSAQGILIKFQPPQDISNFYINFYSPNDELIINFQDENRPSLAVFSEGFLELYQGNLALEPDKFYNLVAGLDSNGEFISLIWEDGNVENQAKYYDNLAERGNSDAFKNADFKFNIGISRENTIKVSRYDVLTFDGIQP